MFYDWTEWLDHVTNPSNKFVLKNLNTGEETPVIITPSGEVMQQGTPQDQTRFNNIESGIIDAHAALALLFNFARQQAWEVEHGTVTLTNSEKAPFNNSKQTVALATVRETADYLVMYEVASFEEEAGSVGDIVVSNKLINGFKMEFTGSTSSATVNYVVIGGYMK